MPDGHGEARAINSSPASQSELLEAGESAGEGDRGSAAPEGKELIDEEPIDKQHATFQLLREEVLEGVGRIGGWLGELRLDSDLDISHGVVRYLELLKLSALLQCPPGSRVSPIRSPMSMRACS